MRAEGAGSVELPDASRFIEAHAAWKTQEGGMLSAVDAAFFQIHAVRCRL